MLKFKLKIKICKISSVYIFKENMLNFLEAFVVDNYYCESWPTSLSYYVKGIDTYITHSEKYTHGEIIYVK